MSYGCMFVLRGVNNLHILHSELVSTAIVCECGLCFDPMNNLLLEESVTLSVHDYAYEVCDGFGSNDASLLLSYEGHSINGVQTRTPLLQRLRILQDLATICVPYAETIEIYLGEDTPYLPDYSDYRVACTDIADVLYREYQIDSHIPFIPCVHLIING